jgi:transposase-like protein
MAEAAPNSVSGFRAPGGRGLASTSASPVSFQRATQTYKAVRRAIQHSQESLRALAGRYGINQKTVAKWKKRTSVADLPTGPKKAASTVLSPDEEAIVIAFRRQGLTHYEFICKRRTLEPERY